MTCDECGKELVISGSVTLESVDGEGRKIYLPSFECYCPCCGKLIYVDQEWSLEG